MKSFIKANVKFLILLILAVIAIALMLNFYVSEIGTIVLENTGLDQAMQEAVSDQLVTISMITVTVISVIVMALCIYLVVLIKARIKRSSMRRARSEFLSRMSHEIRTPLNGIIGLNHLMEQHVDNPEKIKEYTMKMGRTSQYLLAMINDILDVNQMRKGSIHLEAQPFAFEACIDELYAIQGSLMERNGIEFTLEKDIKAPYVVGDMERFEQVVLNLLSNANKYTPRGGKVNFIVRQSEPEDGLVTNTIIVKDTGCGMSKEFCEHIFEAFTQEETKGNNRGSGLGMTISSQLVNAMGGTIDVESVPKVGSTFTVTLTAKAVGREQIKAAAESESGKQLEGLNILVAEDNVLNADILMEILADEGAKATLAVNGQEAVDRFQESAVDTFDFILMDMQMPIMNGNEATKAIRALPRPDAKTVRIFACTANSFKEDEEAAYEAGMDDFITKPVDIKNLFRKLNSK